MAAARRQEEWFASGGDLGDEPQEGGFHLDGLAGPYHRPHLALLELMQVPASYPHKPFRNLTFSTVW